MGRNLDNPFIPSDAGSRLGLPFLSNSFMSTRPFLGEPSSASPLYEVRALRERTQYRRPFSAKSRELASNLSSQPAKSFHFFRSELRASAYRCHHPQRVVDRPGSALRGARRRPSVQSLLMTRASLMPPLTRGAPGLRRAA